MRLTKNEKPIFFMMLIMVFLAVSLVTWTVMMTTQSDNSDSLQSDLDNKITQMYNERNRYLSQIQELEISHDVEISRLNSEYEKKRLTCKNLQ
jgi:cell division protein FtsL